MKSRFFCKISHSISLLLNKDPYLRKETQDKHSSRLSNQMTIEEYILSQSPEVQPLLRQVWTCIREAIPDAEERISWSMPTFKKGRNIIHFAAAKNHIGIYPGPEVVLAFEESLHDYKTSKGTIQIPLDKEIPKDLIAEIAKYSYRLATKKH